MSLCIYTKYIHTHRCNFKRLSLFKIEIMCLSRLYLELKTKGPLALWAVLLERAELLFESTVKTPLSVTASVIDVDGRAF